MKHEHVEEMPVAERALRLLEAVLSHGPYIAEIEAAMQAAVLQERERCVAAVQRCGEGYNWIAAAVRKEETP